MAQTNGHHIENQTNCLQHLHSTNLLNSHYPDCSVPQFFPRSLPSGIRCRNTHPPTSHTHLHYPRRAPGPPVRLAPLPAHRSTL